MRRRCQSRSGAPRELVRVLLSADDERRIRGKSGDDRAERGTAEIHTIAPHRALGLHKYCSRRARVAPRVSISVEKSRLIATNSCIIASSAMV